MSLFNPHVTVTLNIYSLFVDATNQDSEPTKTTRKVAYGSSTYGFWSNESPSS